MEERFRAIPAIEKLVASSALAAWEARLTHPMRVRLAQELVSELRESLRAGGECPPREEIERRLAERFRAIDEGGQRRAINATGIVLHTNLGRAPLGEGALTALRDEVCGYSLLELDAETGERGDRAAFVERLLRLSFGVEAALVVNNNAAAVFLALFALAKGKGAVISRGELVQIGGGFRMPDIFEASGARLVEVGTTNITTADDYRRALRPGHDIALLLKVHRSNFVLRGHAESPSEAALSAIAKEAGIPFVVDLGSGTFGDVDGGASLVCVSGDKLLGGPQAGLVLGEAALVRELRRSPLYRALRLGKTELFLLERTLLDYARGRDVPVARALKVSPGILRERALALAERLTRKFPNVLPQITLEDGEGSVGGGTTPEMVLPTSLVVIAIDDAEAVTRRLLRRRPAVVVRKGKNRIAVDLRTVLPEEEEELAQALLEET